MPAAGPVAAAGVGEPGPPTEEVDEGAGAGGSEPSGGAGRWPPGGSPGATDADGGPALVGSPAAGSAPTADATAAVGTASTTGDTARGMSGMVQDPRDDDTTWTARGTITTGVSTTGAAARAPG